MKTIHAVNAAPWQPGEETQMLQTNKQTDRQTTTVTRWLRCDLGLMIQTIVSYSCGIAIAYTLNY